tara:strand:- start:10573 stop:11931 length:1359 start_codon:yes stop_codon:yes gene_type:complete
LSDNNQDKVKRDPATYSGSASKSVRFRYQGGNISQDVDTSSLPENHLIKEINMNFDSIGCGNSGSEWCNAGADDTVVSTITIESATEIEVISESVAVPYEDGWESYSFTKDVTGDFNTDDTSLNLTITGNDTGNSSNWYGPIIDNLNFTVTTEQYVAPIVEPVVITPVIVEPVIEQTVIVEPVIEQIVEQEITNSIVGGLDLEMSVTNEIILEQPIIEITPVSVNIPTTIDVPVEVDMPELVVAPITSVELPDVSDLNPVSEVEVTQEIVEIEVPEIDESINEEKIENTESTLNESEETTTENETDATSELSNSDETEIKSDESKVVKKSKPKNDKSKKKNDSKKSTVKKDKPKPKVKTVAKTTKSETKSKVISVDSLGQILLPAVYLQVMQDTIKITETLSIQQEMIYEQNSYDLVGITFESSFGGDSADRFNSLLGRQFSYESGTYRRSR